MCNTTRLSPKYFVFMVGCPLPLKHLIISEILIVFKKFHMKAQCVIFCGLTQMIVVVGVYLPVVLATLLAKYYPHSCDFTHLISFPCNTCVLTSDKSLAGYF